MASINRFASLFDGLSSGDPFDPTFAEIVAGDLATGQHRNTSGNPDWFTTAYFHHPDQLRAECEQAGLVVTAVMSVEGMPAWLPQLSARWQDPTDRAVILHAIATVETEPSPWASALT